VLREVDRAHPARAELCRHPVAAEGVADHPWADSVPGKAAKLSAVSYQPSVGAEGIRSTLRN
jgi:hypothetical protein